MFKSLRKPVLVVAFLTVAVVGPAGAGVSTELSRGTATLVFSKGYKSSIGRQGSVTYHLSRDGKCDDWRAVPRMSWTTGNNRTEVVGVDNPAVVQATTEYYYSTVKGGRNYLGIRTCDGVVRFAPEAGHTYDVVHDTPFDGKCRLMVTDRDAGARPPDLTYPKECLFSG